MFVLPGPNNPPGSRNNVQRTFNEFPFRSLLIAGFLAGCAQGNGAGEEGIRVYAGSTVGGTYDAEVAPEESSVVVEGLGAMLLLEAVTGEPRPADVLAEHPELGEFEIDFRVVDKNGIPFIMGFGGDFPADPSWEESYENSLGIPVDPVDREAHYELLGDAAEAIGEIRGDRGTGGFPLEALAGVAASRFAEWHDGTPELDGLIDGYEPDASGGAPPPATTYRHYAYVYYNPLWWTAWNGDHSSFRGLVKNSTGTTTIYDLSYGNHGRYYYESGMSYSCGFYWSGRSSTAIRISPYEGTDTSTGNIGGGCSTGYDTVYPTTGGHVCNDDSYAQYGNVKNDSYSTWSTCSDSTLRKTVPVCSSI